MYLFHLLQKANNIHIDIEWNPSKPTSRNVTSLQTRTYRETKTNRALVNYAVLSQRMSTKQQVKFWAFPIRNILQPQLVHIWEVSM